MPLGGSLDYTFVENDTGSILEVTCKRSDTGAVIDVSGATAVLRYQMDGMGTVYEKNMSVFDGPNGIVRYQFATGELIAGQMVAEVRLTTAAGITTSLEPFHFTVRARLA